MATFQYIAKTRDNTVQKGTLSASDDTAVTKILAERQLTPMVIKPLAGRLDIFHKALSHKVRTRDKVIMSRQLATMVNAGVPITGALTTLQEQSESPALKTVLADVNKRVKGGTALSAAMEAHPKVFDAVFTNMVKAGEAGGILDQILERIATQVEKDAALKSKIRGAMIYPGVITTITFVAFMFLMTVIMPKLKAVFDEFGGQLPLNTRIMLGISAFIRRFWPFMIVAGVGGIIGFLRLLHVPAGKKFFDRLILRMPIIGKVVLKVNIARFARTFSSLAGAGVSVIDSLNVTKQSLSNTIIRDGVDESAKMVKNGKPIAAAFSSIKVFPPILSQMASVGEETGQIEKVLGKIADFYEDEVGRVLNNLTSIIEPLLIIVLGSLVGLVVAAVFEPISKLSDVVK